MSQKTENSVDICWQLHSTLRPTMKRGFDIIPACAGIDIRSQNPEGILCDRMENRGLKPAILIVEQKKFFPSPLPLTWGMGYSELCPLSSDF